MDNAEFIRWYALAVCSVWFVAGALYGLSGGFNFIRRVEFNEGGAGKNRLYWAARAVLLPVIVLRAIILAILHGAAP